MLRPNAAESQARQRLFDYTSALKFLADFADAKRAQNLDWTMGAWARRLGISSTATLTRVINGQRRIGAELSEKFIAYFSFDTLEAEYFRHLILAEKTALDSSIGAFIAGRLTELRTEHSFRTPNDALIGRPLLETQSRSLLALWGSCTVSTLDALLLPEKMVAVDKHGHCLAGFTVANYHHSTLGPFQQAFFCVLAMRRGSQLHRSGLYYRWLFCDQRAMATQAELVWGQVNQQSEIRLSHGGKPYPLWASVGGPHGLFFTLDMAAGPAAVAEEEISDVWGISNRSGHQSRYLARMTMFGHKRLFDPACDRLECGKNSPFSEYVKKIDFKPYSWASYERVNGELFGPGAL